MSKKACHVRLSSHTIRKHASGGSFRRYSLKFIRERTTQTFQKLLFQHCDQDAQMSDVEEDEEGLIVCRSSINDGVPAVSAACFRGSAVNEAQQCLRELLNSLEEKNMELFVRIVARVGVQTCRDILRETRALVRRGGVLRETGEPRTLGGTFIWLLKKRVSEQDLAFIFEEQKRMQAAFKKDKKLVKRLNVLVADCLSLEDHSPEVLERPAADHTQSHCCSDSEFEEGQVG